MKNIIGPVMNYFYSIVDDFQLNLGMYAYFGMVVLNN